MTLNFQFRLLCRFFAWPTKHLIINDDRDPPNAFEGPNVKSKQNVFSFSVRIKSICTTHAKADIYIVPVFGCRYHYPWRTTEFSNPASWIVMASVDGSIVWWFVPLINLKAVPGERSLRERFVINIVSSVSLELFFSVQTPNGTLNEFTKPLKSPTMCWN